MIAIMPSRLPRRFRTIAVVGALGLLAACDPFFKVGARLQLPSPTAATTDTLHERPARTALAAAPLDVPATADCLAATIRASASYSDLKRFSQPKYYRARYADMNFAIVDSLARGGWRHVGLSLRAYRREPPVLEVITLFSQRLGEKESLVDQRRVVELATTAVRALRRACLPAAPDEVQCVDEGRSGRLVCGGG